MNIATTQYTNPDCDSGACSSATGEVRRLEDTALCLTCFYAEIRRRKQKNRETPGTYEIPTSWTSLELYIAAN